MRSFEWCEEGSPTRTRTQWGLGVFLLNGWNNRACEWCLKPILEELGRCRPTRLGKLCGSSGVELQCSHALGDQEVVFRGGL